ncbi:arsenical pump membrane protein [Arthrobacter sp. Hiyo8]|nr:arsenical pump membrane protein [Arthrobacter sp. Hiyo8]
MWLANTASLLLPISNLTNLLAQHSLGGITPGGFAGLMWAPSLAAVVVPLLFIAVVFRRDLRNRYSRIPVGRIRPDQPAGLIPGLRRTGSCSRAAPWCWRCCYPRWCPGSRSGSRPWPVQWFLVWCSRYGARGFSRCR